MSLNPCKTRKSGEKESTMKAPQIVSHSTAESNTQGSSVLRRIRNPILTVLSVAALIGGYESIYASSAGAPLQIVSQEKIMVTLGRKDFKCRDEIRGPYTYPSLGQIRVDERSTGNSPRLRGVTMLSSEINGYTCNKILSAIPKHASQYWITRTVSRNPNTLLGFVGNNQILGSSLTTSIKLELVIPQSSFGGSSTITLKGGQYFGYRSVTSFHGWIEDLQGSTQGKSTFIGRVHPQALGFGVKCVPAEPGWPDVFRLELDVNTKGFANGKRLVGPKISSPSAYVQAQELCDSMRDKIIHDSEIADPTNLGERINIERSISSQHQIGYGDEGFYASCNEVQTEILKTTLHGVAFEAKTEFVVRRMPDFASCKP